MKLIVFFGLSLFIVNSAFGRPNDNGKVCEGGSQWKEDCNSCTCTPDGTAKTCTRKSCIPKEEAPAKVCEPNSHWKEKCNSCVCNADGTASGCTRRACEEDHLDKISEKKSSETEGAHSM